MSQETVVYLNDRFVDYGEALVPVLDRGYIFGDGVYEVIRDYGWGLFRMREHLERLERSAQAVEIPLPCSISEMESIIKEAVRRYARPVSQVYVQLTRGVAGRTHRFPPLGTTPTLLIMVYEPPLIPSELYEDGATVITVPDIRWLRCDIKSINLLPNVLAKEKASRAGAFEAIFVRENGRVTEGSSSNVFLVDDSGKVITAPATSLILSGITRAAVIECALEAGYELEQRFPSLDELYSSREVFFTCSSSRVMPVTCVDGRTIGDGKPGPVTRDLMKRYDVLCRNGKP